MKTANSLLMVGVLGLLVGAAGALTSCTSTTEAGEVGTGRKQFVLISAAEIEQQSALAYSEIKTEASKKGQLNKNPELTRRVQGIAEKLKPHVTVFRKDAVGWAWEANVIDSPEINAFCMPGGKMIVYSGIVEKLKLTDGELAAIMGHEMAHALREHGRERVSQEMVKQMGLAVAVRTGVIDPKWAGVTNAGLMIGLQMPNGRAQESEADSIGVELMARAGFNPKEAVSLWQKMAKASGGGKPPEFLSTHPADNTRIRNIESLLSRVQPLYNEAIR